MENNELPEVTRHLKAMQTFYLGDLKVFKERYEEIKKMKVTSSTTTTETTSETTHGPDYDSQSHHTNEYDDYLKNQSKFDKAISTYQPVTDTTHAPGYDNQSNSKEKYEEYINNQKDFLLTIPITLVTFSIIDIVGNLKKNESYNNSKKKKTSLLKGEKDNFKSFFLGFYDNYNLKEEQLEAMAALYRNGLAHSYFPKLDLSISYDSGNPDNRLFFNLGNEIVLNVNYLVYIVPILLNLAIEKSLSDTNMQKRYSDLIGLYNKDINQYIRKLI